MGSEWNRYILPLVKDYRYGIRTKEQLEESLKKGGSIGYLGNKNFDIQLADYNWFGDLTLGTIEETDIHGYNGQITWVQEFADESERALRGGNDINWGASTYFSSYPATHTSISYGFRPVLEEIPQNCYDGACFEGEVAGTDFITYRKLLSELTGKKEESFIDDKCIDNPNYDADYQCGGLGSKISVGADAKIGGIWLKIHDYTTGKVLYIAKKPITNYVTWLELYKNGVVFDSNIVLDDKNKLKSNLDFGLEVQMRNGENPIKLKPYNPRTIELGGKTYLIRLLRATSNINTNGPRKQYYNLEDLEKSEWNRYILPLIRNNRYSYNKYVQKELRLTTSGIEIDRELPNKENYQIQLTTYDWNKDLNIYNKRKSTYEGNMSLTQEIITRGDFLDAADITNVGMIGTSNNFGFRPVLEEISKQDINNKPIGPAT